MIRLVLYVYMLMIVVDFVITFFPQYKNHEYVVNLRKATGLLVNPIRKLLPADLPFDFSHMIAVAFIKIMMLLW